MCGICGIVYRDRDRPIQPGLLARMTDSIAHRGPDDQGQCADGNAGLGHRRLSIVDLSAHGHQPMVSASGRYTITFNGEIYNFRELRAGLEGAGYPFTSRTDTEVILALFEREGAACVERLNGMFAFAIWDRDTRSLFAARDRLGIKPFYFAHRPEVFVFGSEIKSILASGAVQPEIDREGLADYLTFQFCLGAKSLFAGVQPLLPGQSLTLDAGGRLDVRAYWRLDFTVDPEHTESYFRETLRELLDDAVRLQLQADVPVGAHLSGGLDSSALCCFAAQQVERPLHTFSGRFAEGAAFDESRYSRLVSQRIGSVHHEVVPTAQEFVDWLPDLIYKMDEPAAGPGLFPQYAVARAARPHVKVVLGGQGGDEVFGGYARYLIAYLEECIRGGINGTQEDDRYVVTFATIVENLPQLKGYEPLLKRFWQDGLFEAPDRRYFRLIDRSATLRDVVEPAAFTADGAYDPFESYRAVFHENETRSYIGRMTGFDIRTLLPALLQVEDRVSMSVSLESRVPLLDHRIVELAAAMPPRFKYKGGQSKYLFRQAMAGTVPPEILARKDKMGFPVPLDVWYRTNPVREFIADTLNTARVRRRGLLQDDVIGRLLRAEPAYGRSVWGLLSLELWMQAFIDRGVTVDALKS